MPLMDSQQERDQDDATAGLNFEPSPTQAGRSWLTTVTQNVQLALSAPMRQPHGRDYPLQSCTASLSSVVVASDAAAKPVNINITNN